VQLEPAKVKALNNQIRLLAERLPGKDDPNHKYGFSCECGCGQIVPLSTAEFDREGGAWAEGHRPAELRAS
jgi:hypothetical protein